MGEIVAKKSTDYELALPFISVASPEQYASGETVVDVAYSQTGAGAWLPLTLSDSMLEIAVSGMYQMTILAAELAYDQVLVKFTGAGMADDAVLFRLSNKLIDDLNDFDPASDDVAHVLLVDEVVTVRNIINVTTITSTATQVCDVFDATQPYHPGVPDILANVRDSLSDPDADRYSELRLVRLLDKAQKDLNIRTRILRAKVVFYLTPNQNLYTLPTDTRQITRVNGVHGPIPLMTHEEIDELYGDDWETDTGSKVLAIVYDKQNQKGFKTYPVLEDPTGEDAIYNYNMDDFGIVSHIEDFTADSDYGVIVSVDDTVYFPTVYGTLSELLESNEEFQISMYTNVNPQTLEAALGDDGWVYSSLQVPDTYDTILEHYVTGIALRDDLDTQNRELGREHLALYADLVQQVMTDSAKDNVNSSRKGNNTPPKYNGAF